MYARIIVPQKAEESERDGEGASQDEGVAVLLDLLCLDGDVGFIGYALDAQCGVKEATGVVGHGVGLAGVVIVEEEAPWHSRSRASVAES